MEAYALTFKNFGYLLRISWAWLVLMVSLSLAFYASVFWYGWQNPENYFSSVLREVLGDLLFQPYFASIAVAWHRRFLANEVWPSLVYMRFDRLVASYFGLSVIIYILTSGLILLPKGELTWHYVFLFLSSRRRRVLDCYSAQEFRWLFQHGPWDIQELLFGRLGQQAVGMSGDSSPASFSAVLPSARFFVLAMILGLDPDEASQPLSYAMLQTLFQIVPDFLVIPLLSFLLLAYRRLIQQRNAATPA
jgi:hypothetical protein